MSHGARLRIDKQQEVREVPYQSGGASDARTRLAIKQSGPQAQPITMTELWNASVRAEKERIGKAADEAEQKRKAHEQQVRQNQENERQRRVELQKQQAALKSIAKDMLTRAVENELTQSSITSAMESMSATEVEVKEVGRRIKQTQGDAALKVPSLWQMGLEALRQERRTAGGI